MEPSQPKKQTQTTKKNQEKAILLSELLPATGRGL
jgi:hypothetical protein